eukprot:CAMPEP_0117490748 /NCGR_PEP_ID=MMETSP0784-20121206/17709_1 /TAXON_ID=39447 /ORGANISM="" /LENGTH=130 /DNA_ID=CAMNT_0005285513 /DNA_START=62 /DNA_END=455 /DNA_ORIENTATION=-
MLHQRLVSACRRSAVAPGTLLGGQSARRFGSGADLVETGGMGAAVAVSMALTMLLGPKGADAAAEPQPSGPPLAEVARTQCDGTSSGGEQVWAGAHADECCSLRSEAEGLAASATLLHVGVEHEASVWNV